MPLPLVLLLLAQGNPLLRDWLSGAEIGDREQAMTFSSTGHYRAERKAKAGQTLARGSWKLEGTTLVVTVSSCKGPACQRFGTSFRAELTVVGERALTVNPTPADVPFARGSYYCHHQGCEPRPGVRVTAHAAPAAAVSAVTERLIDRNVGRNTTVVWATQLDSPIPQSGLLYCPRGGDGARQAAAATAADLAGMQWLGPLEPTVASGDCLWDVEVQVGDAVAMPSAPARTPP